MLSIVLIYKLPNYFVIYGYLYVNFILFHLIIYELMSQFNVNKWSYETNMEKHIQKVYMFTNLKRILPICVMVQGISVCRIIWKFIQSGKRGKLQLRFFTEPEIKTSLPGRGESAYTCDPPNWNKSNGMSKVHKVQCLVHRFLTLNGKLSQTLEEVQFQYLVCRCITLSGKQNKRKRQDKDT